MKTKTRLHTLLLCLALAATGVHAQEAAGWGFEAVLDTRGTHAEGLPVLAVTPGGAAARMGILTGDRILTINGRPLGSVAAPARELDAALRASNGRAEVLLLRDGRRITLQGPLARTQSIPVQQGCGYVSDSDPTPRASGQVYSGEITQVDGRSTPLAGSTRLRVGAGTHVLVVREFIPGQWLTASQNQARRQMQKRLQAKAYKAIVVDVAPDTRYSIGTRLLRDKLDLDSIRANAYWEPVVYSTRTEGCR